jgi:AcrR family transcriptional regulator
MDRRVQKTRQALQDALIALILEKGYEAVTVQDVLDRANVGRSTFYAHFYDLEDLLQSELEALQGEFEQHLASQNSAVLDIWEISRLMFQHAQAYQNVYKAIVGKASGQLIQKHLQAYLSAKFREGLKRDYAESKLISHELLEYHLVSSFMALLTWWLDKELPYSAEQMAEMYQELMNEGINKLKNP